MIRRRWIVVICMLLFFVSVILIQPFLFRQQRIELLAGIELPKSFRIVEYKVGINPLHAIDSFYGINKFYAKVAIDQDTYESWRENSFVYNQEMLDIILRVAERQNSKSLNLENAEEILVRESMTSEYNFLIIGTTGVIYSTITKETSGNCYLYVLS